MTTSSRTTQTPTAQLDQTDFDDALDLFAAIDLACAEARAAHEAGACAESEWSCSHCEEEGK